MARQRIEIPSGHLFVKYKNSAKPTAIYLSYHVDKTISTSTGVKIYPTNWDDVRCEVKKTDSDYKRKNKIIHDLMADVDRRIKEYYDEGNMLTSSDITRILRGDELARKKRSVTFIDYAKETNDLRHGKDIGYTTWYNSDLYIKKFGEFLEKQYGTKDLKVSQINADYINHYIKWRENVLHNTSLQGINKTLTPLIKAAERAYNHDLISHKIFNDIQSSYLDERNRDYTGLEEEDKDVKYLTEIQLNDFVALYDKARKSTQKYMDLFLFSFHACGLRISDVITLEWSHIDFEKRKLKKRLVKFNKPNEFFLTDSALAILKKYHEKKENIRFVFNLLPKDFNLLDKDAFMKKRQSVNRTIQTSLTSLGKKIGLDFNLTMHVARHTFAVMALRQNVSLHMISVLMGHGSVVTTEKVYAEFLPDDKDAIVREKLSFSFLPTDISCK